MHQIFNRQLIPGLDLGVYEEEMRFLVEQFGEKWIFSPKGANPLQQLMARKDELATSELFSFASNLRTLWKQNSKWAKEQIKIIKEGNPNNRQGAFFEINGLGMFESLNQRIVPASRNNPGTDGACFINEEKILSISLKNYGISTHHENFLRDARKSETIIVELIQTMKPPPIQLLIGSFKSYPDKTNWKALTDQIDKILDDFIKTKASKLYMIDDFWLVRPSRIDESENYYNEKSSYQMLIVSNYHRNEKKNLVDKLEEACANLSKFGKLESETEKNALVIRLSELASITTCKAWANEYLEVNPNKPISAIILYQPTVATSTADGRKQIHNCYQVAHRNDEQIEWLYQKNLNLSFPLRLMSTHPANLKIMKAIDQTLSDDNLEEVYWYQSGNHYMKSEINEDGSVSGYVGSPGSGIFVHSVWEPSVDSGAVTFGGYFPPDERLKII